MKSEVVTLFFGFMFGIAVTMVFVTVNVNEKKEKYVKEYITHPENFKVQYLTDGKDTVEIRVHYIK